MNIIKRKIIYICLISMLTIATALVVSLTIIINNKPLDKTTTITIKDYASEILDINIDNMNPGDSNSYLVNIKSKDIGTYNITSIIGNQSGDLFNYISLSIKYNDEYYLNNISLNDYLNDPCSFNVSFSNNNTNFIEYIYYIDSSIGNDCENLSASFDCILEMKRVN